MRYFTLFMAVLLFSFSATASEGDHAGHGHEDKKKVEKKHTDSGMTRKEILQHNFSFDVVYGDEKAPITVIEYASLSCSHCRDFYDDVFPKLKEKYIDTGKVKLVFRAYPLNVAAIRAAMLVDCVEGNDKKQKFIGALFKSQNEWAYSRSEEEFTEKLKAIGKIGGFEADKFDACVTNKEKEEAILGQQLEASKKLGVSSTPTIFIGKKRFNKERNIESMSKAIDKALEKLKDK